MRSLKLNVITVGKLKSLNLLDVLYIYDLRENLLSVTFDYSK